MKLLVVDDNKRLADRVKQQLVKTYLVDVAHTGEQALECVLHMDYAVITLDLGLPDISGEEVCRRLRGMGIHTPVLVLSGESSMDTRVRLLESGADDYIVKPFHVEELKARIAALARRPPLRKSKRLLTHRDLVIDSDERKVYRNGQAIDLRRKEYDILEYLVSNSGRTVTREMILSQAWDTDKVSLDGTVDVHIKHLRDKIDRPSQESLIKTVYGLGYKVDTSG
jgi:DNA-binding response OmpR family regulator